MQFRQLPEKLNPTFDFGAPLLHFNVGEYLTLCEGSDSF